MADILGEIDQVRADVAALIDTDNANVQQIGTLQAQVATDAAQIMTLQGQVAADASQISALQAQVAELEAELNQQPPPPPPPPTTNTMLGMSMGNSIPGNVTTFPVTRVYYQPGEKLGLWQDNSVLVQAYEKYGARRFHISLKSLDEAGFPAFRASCPPDVELMWTFFHEQDDDIRKKDLSLADYQAGCASLAKSAHDAGDTFGPIHNGMVYDSNKTPHWGLYSEIWSADEAADTSIYDWWGADDYTDTYQDPETRYGPLRDYAASLGVPLVIGELASPASDPASQATWAGNMRTWCEDPANNVLSAMWWPNDTWALTSQAATEWLDLTS
jgi:hypothetical protein